MRSEEDASRAIDQYADTVRRICMVHLKNYDDTEPFRWIRSSKSLRKRPRIIPICWRQSWLCPRNIKM